MTDFPTLCKLHVAKSLPFYTPEALKRNPFQVESSCIGLNWEYTPTPLPSPLRLMQHSPAITCMSDMEAYGRFFFAGLKLQTITCK